MTRFHRAGSRPTSRLRLVGDRSTSIDYDGRWHVARHPGYRGGTVRYATGRGARATLTFTGEAGQRVRVEAEITHDVISADACCGYEMVVQQAGGPELGRSERHNGALDVELTLPASGEYVIRLRALGNSGGQLQVSVREVG